VGKCSSVDGQAAFLEELAEHRHVDYFQGLEQFHEHGLPCGLPAAKRDELENDPDLCEFQTEARALTRTGASFSVLNEAKIRLSACRRTLERETLRQHQKQWIQDRRVWKILTRGEKTRGRRP